MRISRIVFSVIGLALLGAVIFQVQTNARLRRELAAAIGENSRLRPDTATTQEIPASLGHHANQEINGNASEPLNDADRARLEELEAEVMRLRGVAARVTRAEADVAQVRMELEQRRSATSAEGAEAMPNTNAVFKYLGEAVPTPQNLNFAYTKEGLLNGIQEAARNAGVTLKKIEIESSEFPFLAGVVCEQEADFEKLKEQFKQMNVYQYNGSVSSHTSYAFNLVPYRAYPPGSAEQINRRTMLRQQMFYHQLTGAQN